MVYGIFNRGRTVKPRTITIGWSSSSLARRLPRPNGGNRHINNASPSAKRFRFLRIRNTNSAIIECGWKPNFFTLNDSYK